MASRRIAKTAIDWVAFAERVPESQKQFFLAFKAKSESYLRKVAALPEQTPKIDWAFYKSKIFTPGIVDQFEKQYSALAIPFPADKVTAEINAQESQAENETVDFVKASQERIAKYKAELERWEKIIPIEQMTMEEFHETFPELAIDPMNAKTFWPHTKESQQMPAKSSH